MPSRTTKRSKHPRDVAAVAFDALYGSVVERHERSHHLAQSTTVLGDAELVRNALTELGYDAAAVPLIAESAAGVIKHLAEAGRTGRPLRIVVNLCDTLDGKGDHALVVPALLSALGVPFAGAPAPAIALSKRKHDVKAVLSRDGLPTPRYQVLREPADIDAFALRVEPPVILKLTAEHASIGLTQASVCATLDEIRAQARALFARFPGQPVLVEEYVDGREFSVSILGDPPRALPPMELPFDHVPAGYLRLRTFDMKWTNAPGAGGDAPRAPLGAVPVREPSVPYRWTLDGMVEAALRAFVAVGCRDWGRVDFRVDRGGVPLIIDVTPNTYLGRHAPCVKAAEAAGLDYAGLVKAIVDGALRRHTDGKAAPPAGSTQPIGSTQPAPPAGVRPRSPKGRVRTRSGAN